MKLKKNDNHYRTINQNLIQKNEIKKFNYIFFLLYFL